jgi:hypothetical protein
MTIDEDALAEWRAHPVTSAVLGVLAGAVEAQRKAATDAYWTGQAWPEDERKALLRYAALVEDLELASADDFTTMMETMRGE